MRCLKYWRRIISRIGCSYPFDALVLDTAIPPAKNELRDLSTTLNEMMDRLEAAFQRITQFTADASHELRTPIALIRTTAELGISDPSPQAAREALSSILEESERTTRFLEQLLALARADSNSRFQLESVDLVFVARQAQLQTEVLALTKRLAIDLSTSSRNFHEKFRFPA